jgi:hypothetical protein
MNQTPEEIELNSIQHILQHHSNQPLNQDFSCYWCYPPTPITLTTPAFQNFWDWFNREFQADTYSAQTVTAFTLFEELIFAPETEHRDRQLAEVIIRIFISVRFRRRIFSTKVLYYYIQGLANRTNCFQFPVDFTASLAVFRDILDQSLLQLQQDRQQVEETLAVLTPVTNLSKEKLLEEPPLLTPRTTTPRPLTPLTPPVVTAAMGITRDEMQTIFNAAFNVDATVPANNGAITNLLIGQQNAINQLRTATQNRGNKIVDVNTFHGKDNEDPHEWLQLFNQAHETNGWPEGNNGMRKVQIAAGYLREAAQDWFQNDRTNIDRWHTDGDNGSFDIRFINYFSTNDRRNRWARELQNLKQGDTETVEDYSRKF